MKILLIHSGSPARESVDLWRIIRPFKELSKHVDWQIDHRPDLIPRSLYDKDAKVDTEELIKELEKLKDYDIVWSSYFPDATMFDCMMFVQMKYGTKFVLDCDDDLYNVPKHFPLWSQVGYKGIKELQYTVEETPYLVVSTPYLKKHYESKRQAPTYLLKNYIGKDFVHKPFNNKEVVIGYFGSITHKVDVLDTGFVEALQMIIDKYPNVHVLAVGQDLGNYLPKDRYTYHVGKPGKSWVEEIWPNINCDIATGPLIDDKFNKSKSNIKYLEATLIPSVFVASNVEPYKDIKGILTDNSTEGWYEALEKLVLDEELRKKLLKQAQEDVKLNWTIEYNWPELRDIVSLIFRDK